MVQELLDKIGSLTIVQAAELVKAMEDKFGISAAAPVAVAAVAAPAAGAAAAGVLDAGVGVGAASVIFIFLVVSVFVLLNFNHNLRIMQQGFIQPVQSGVSVSFIKGMVCWVRMKVCRKQFCQVKEI